MAINNGRLVVSPTTERSENKDPCVTITGTVPPATRLVMVNGVPTPISQSPEYEGQLLCYSDGANLHQLYVAVIINSTLTWKLAHFPTEYIDSTTGLPFRSL